MARVYGESLSVSYFQPQISSGELGNFGDGGRLRCLHGKVDVCTCIVGPAECFGCVIYGCGCHLHIVILQKERVNTTHLQC